VQLFHHGSMGHWQWPMTYDPLTHFHLWCVVQRMANVSALRQAAWRGSSSLGLHDQQSALLSLSAIADCIQLPAPSSSAAAAATLSPAFIPGSQSFMPAYTPSLQVREVACLLQVVISRLLKSEFLEWGVEWTCDQWLLTDRLDTAPTVEYKYI